MNKIVLKNFQKMGKMSVKLFNLIEFIRSKRLIDFRKFVTIFSKWPTKQPIGELKQILLGNGNGS